MHLDKRLRAITSPALSAVRLEEEKDDGEKSTSTMGWSSTTSTLSAVSKMQEIIDAKVRKMKKIKTADSRTFIAADCRVIVRLLWCLFILLICFLYKIYQLSSSLK